MENPINHFTAHLTPLQPRRNTFHTHFLHRPTCSHIIFATFLLWLHFYFISFLVGFSFAFACKYPEVVLNRFKIAGTFINTRHPHRPSFARKDLTRNLPTASQLPDMEGQSFTRTLLYLQFFFIITIFSLFLLHLYCCKSVRNGRWGENRKQQHFRTQPRLCGTSSIKSADTMLEKKSYMNFMYVLVCTKKLWVVDSSFLKFGCIIHIHIHKYFKHSVHWG